MVESEERNSQAMLRLLIRDGIRARFDLLFYVEQHPGAATARARVQGAWRRIRRAADRSGGGDMEYHHPNACEWPTAGGSGIELVGFHIYGDSWFSDRSTECMMRAIAYNRGVVCRNFRVNDSVKIGVPSLS